MARVRRSPLAGAAPLPARVKWRAILLATLLLVPGYWALLAGVVSAASDGDGVANPGAFVAFGLMLIPFVFMVLAFGSQHPRAPAAVVKAMVLALVIGIPVSALASDAVTGLVAGLGAGGVAALRADLPHDVKPRALAVAAATIWVFAMLRIAPEAAILLGPVLPFASLGVADHLWERRQHPAG
jgi:hypothetical protein